MHLKRELKGGRPAVKASAFNRGEHASKKRIESILPPTMPPRLHNLPMHLKRELKDSENADENSIAAPISVTCI